MKAEIMKRLTSLKILLKRALEKSAVDSASLILAIMLFAFLYAIAKVCSIDFNDFCTVLFFLTSVIRIKRHVIADNKEIKFKKVPCQQ